MRFFLTLSVVAVWWCVASSSESLLINSRQTPAPTSAQSTRQNWQPGSYAGITAGKSTRDDVIRVFGKPQREAYAEDDRADQVWYVYDRGGEFPGQFTVAFDKKSGLVALMFLQTENLSRETIIERHGKDYVVKRYDFCPGFDNAESAPSYESEQGDGIYIEYPSQGIAILTDVRGSVYDIQYLKEPVGFSSKIECQEALAKRRTRPKKHDD